MLYEEIIIYILYIIALGLVKKTIKSNSFKIS